MKTLEELCKEFEGKTIIQQEEKLKKLIGVEVEILGEISNIDSKHINLAAEPEYSGCGSLALKLPYGTLISISYESSQLGNELLEYSSGDEVKLVTRLTGAHFVSYSAHYNFSILSLLKLTTRDERVKKAKLEEEKRKESDKARFEATTIGFFSILGGGTVVGAILGACLGSGHPFLGGIFGLFAGSCWAGAYVTRK